RERAAGDRQEAKEFRGGAAGRTFRDIGRNADCTASELCNESEAFPLGKRSCVSVCCFHQSHGVAPDFQLGVRPLERIPNHESRIPAVQEITNMGSSNSTGWPFSTRMALTVPETSASIGLNIFIASMMPRVSPLLTCWPTLTKAGLSGDGAA